MAVNIPGPLQLYDSGTDRILPFCVDLSETGKGVIPVFRETKDLREQPPLLSATGSCPEDGSWT